MIVVAIRVANVLALRKSPSAQALEAKSPQPELASHRWLAAGLSLSSWVTARLMERLIGYF